MHTPDRTAAPQAPEQVMTNADIAHRLGTVAQLLSARGENPFKIKAYRRAAASIQALPESVAALVHAGADLTALAGIGKGIAGAIQEIVTSGELRQIERLRAAVPPEVAALSEYPRLDPKRVQQIYRKLGIASVAELKAQLESGELGRRVGPRLEHHVRQALLTSHELLLYDADELVPAITRYLLERCGATRVEPAGAFRRRVEVVQELTFVVETDDFDGLVRGLQAYGGQSALVSADAQRATVRLPIGILATVESATAARWGATLLVATGSEAHLAELEAHGHDLARLTAGRARLGTEAAVYRALGLAAIPPELREGHGEVELAERRKLPRLVTLDDIRGDLHMHTTLSDGAASLEEMAEAARARGYSYLGIADHSQSLKIANGATEADVWRQLRRIDRLNEKLRGIRILKSAEVDILVDGRLDYSDALLAELDYTVCSIHSRFGLGREEQTTRLLRAMDNPHFGILGHATGRLLLRRPGYAIDIERVITHARERGCHFEINASPDRLDLSAEHARLVREAGIGIAINTDAHSPLELDFMRCGIDVARRAGLSRSDVLNCLPWPQLLRKLRGRLTPASERGTGPAATATRGSGGGVPNRSDEPSRRRAPAARRRTRGA